MKKCLVIFFFLFSISFPAFCEDKGEIAKGSLPRVQKPDRAIIIDHTCTQVEKIPTKWLDEARKTIRIWYTHTSHGSQITSGMDAMNRSPFAFNENGEGGALAYREGDGDLGGDGNLDWAQTTRNALKSGEKDRNLVMWSWCGGCSENNAKGINAYLNEMSRLEKEFPDILFVYMTGHLDGTGANGKLNRCNNLIRAYCTKENKILFDFADIESFDPDGNTFLDRGADDSCAYDKGRKDAKDGNWAEEWIAKHPKHGFNLPSEAAHTHPLNGALKGRAFWWLMARLSGWDGKPWGVFPFPKN